MLDEVARLEAELAEEEARLIRLLEASNGTQSADITGTGRSTVEELRRAQQAWQQYREAQCSFAYATALGGELRGLNAARCLRDLLRERVQRLRGERARLEAEPRLEAEH